MQRERRGLADLHYGDHVCLVYQNEEEYGQIVTEFVGPGLRAGDRCAVIVEDSFRTAMLEELERVGIPAYGHQERGALQLLSPQETYLRFDPFDPRRMVELLRQMVDQAVADGFSGLRITGKAEWVLSGGSAEGLNEYEQLLNHFFPTSRAIGLCQYSRRRESRAALYNGLLAHPWTAVGGHAVANPFYEFPDRQRSLDGHVEWMIGRLEAEERGMATLMQTEDLYRSLITAIPAAMYATDAAGRITLYNEQAAQLWGRRPEIGKEQWCGSFRIFYPDGSPMPLDQCPMAVTLREGRSVRGQEIIVERPDGSRATILPHPEPLRNAQGEMIGALNMLVDISDRKRAEEIQMLLATIVESSEDAIMSLTLDGRILTWNAGAEQLFGYSAAEAIGQPIALIVPQDRWGEEKRILARLQRGERIKHYDTVRVSKSGRHIDISLSLSPIRDCTGRITAASKVARDITERRQAEQERLRLLAAEHQARAEAERSRRSYQDLVNGLDAIVWEADAQTWKFHFVSQRAEQILGYPVRRWLEEPDFWTQVIHPDDREWAVRLCKSACQKCADHDFEYRAVAADGRVLWLRDIVYVVTNKDGTADRLRGVMFDVTRTKQLEADLQKRAQELSESDRRKDEFLAMLGHELRNPLAPIRTGLDILTACGMDHEAITIMRSQVDCLVRLVDDLLDVSRITRGKIRLQKKDVDLASIARRAVEATAALAAERRHEVRVSAPSGVWVSGDAVRLAQVVTNLLNNAIKYTPPNGRIEVTVSRENGHATLSVRDNGMGIDPDGLTRIFEPFIQCERARENYQGGLGIGLTLVRSLIEMHGGTVCARSDGPGRGSEFVVRLPVLSRQAELQPTEECVVGPTRHRRILVVDDNLSAARTLEMLITRLGEYDVHVVHDGPAALEALLRLSPDVALIDVDLPGMDGHQVVRKFQATGDASGTMLVALTGFGTPDDRQRSLQAGFALHLVKPVSLRDLRTLLGQLPSASRPTCSERHNGGGPAARLAASAVELERPANSPGD